jgi:hypothetical protein
MRAVAGLRGQLQQAPVAQPMQDREPVFGHIPEPCPEGLAVDGRQSTMDRRESGTVNVSGDAVGQTIDTEETASDEI